MIPNSKEESELKKLGLSENEIAQLQIYADLLLKWNSKINLISKNTELEIWNRHILDSAQVIRYIPENAENLIDLGTGAGLPGLVIAIAKPNLRIYLVESDARKCAFLQEAKTKLNLANVIIENNRVEKMTDLKADIVTARAFTSLKLFLNLALAFQKKSCLNILLKGSNLPNESDEARDTYHFKMDIFDSITEKSGKLAIVTDIKLK